MTNQEIYDELLAFRKRQIGLDVDPNADYFNSIMFDIARTLGLSDEQAAALADDEIPTDLITISDAAKIMGITTQSVAGHISRGKLSSYTDESEKNPRRQRRVSKNDVLAMKKAP